MRQYKLMGEEITTLVVQKLAYLLQRSGENLNLRFDKGYYGPYSPNLNKVLVALSPGNIAYDGDLNKPTTRINLIPQAKVEAETIIKEKLTAEQSERHPPDAGSDRRF